VFAAEKQRRRFASSGQQVATLTGLQHRHFGVAVRAVDDGELHQLHFLEFILTFRLKHTQNVHTASTGGLPWGWLVVSVTNLPTSL